MSRNSIGCAWAGCAVIALAALTSSAARAGIPADEKVDAPAVVVAQAPASDVRVPQAALPTNAFPTHQRGVRQAAAESNEALRRYIWRTRMIYDFYYNDFAPKE